MNMTFGMVISARDHTAALLRVLKLWLILIYFSFSPESKTVVRGAPVKEEEVLVEHVTTHKTPKSSDASDVSKEQYINKLGAQLKQIDESHPTVEHLTQSSTSKRVSNFKTEGKVWRRMAQ